MIEVMSGTEKDQIAQQVRAFLDRTGYGAGKRLAQEAGVSRETVRRVRNGEPFDHESGIKLIEAMQRLSVTVALDALKDATKPPQPPELFPGAALVVQDLRRLADLIEQTGPQDVYPLRAIEAGFQQMADSLPDLRELLARVRQLP